jgi:long-subunit fatty acid transport protein
VTPSYGSADKTGLVTEPEKAFGLKTKLSYAATSGMLTSGYYNHKNTKNANNAFFNSLAGGAATTSITQDTNKTQQAAGVSLNLPVSARINTTASLSWMRDDFATYYLSSDVRRYDPPGTALNFLTRDRSDYNIDTYVLTLGGDWQVNDALRYNGSYTFSQSKGNTASGLILTELPAVDGSINNSTHTLTLGADYALKKYMKNMMFKASYAYDYYTDKVYSTLTGGYHTLMLGVSVGF